MGPDGTCDERQSLDGLRDLAVQLLAADADPARSDAEIAPLRDRTRTAYRAYVECFGPLNRGELREGTIDPQTGRPRLRWHRPPLGGFRRDPSYHLVMALEVFDQSSGRADPAPVLLRRLHGTGPTTRASTPWEALLVARTDRSDGVIDLDRVAGLLGLSGAAAAEGALGRSILRDPERGGAWVAAVDYLTGDVRARLQIAREAAGHDQAYARNVDALEAVVPPELGPSDIEVSLGSPVLRPDDVEAFAHDELGGRITAWHLPSAAWWKVVPTGRIPRSRYDSGRMNANEILAAGLNGRLPIVLDSVPGPVPGKRVRRRNTEQSLAAQDRLSAMQERFRTWVWEDAARAERLCADYNARFNSHVPPSDAGAQLHVPGLVDGIELWPWQRDVIARVVSSPATLCAHAVGAGKTLSMIGSAMTARRLGLASKPLVAVPAHLVEQVAREARQAFPGGAFLVLGESASGSRRDVAARCATGDWDAVIVSHGLLAAVPVAPEVERADLDARVSRTEAEIAAGAGGRHGRSLLRRRLATLQARVDDLARSARPALTFDELGVDMLLVDEAHYFKRLPITTRREGISLGSSQRAADLALKARTLRARRGRLPSLALFTGTPWSNTVAETFVWQTLVQPEVLGAAGIAHFDAWAAAFVEYDTLVEVSPDSAGLRVIQRPSKVRNLPELVRMLHRNAVVLPPGELGLEQPERRDDTVVCRAGPAQLAYLRGLATRADKIRRERSRGGPGQDNMLALCTDGRRAALDPRLVGVDETSPKVDAVADRVAQVFREHAGVRFDGSDERGVLQIVFCDQGTPGPDGPQTYGRLRIALADRGVPPDRVRWVHAARTPAERTTLFADCRAGRVAVLIGSTDTLGTGSNVQTRLRAVHHADAPWRPSDVEQREGRALRPGNANAEVEIVRYVTRGSFDGYMWQTLERKARFIEDLRSGHVEGRIADDLGDTVLSYAEVKALAIGDPLLLEHTQAAAEVARLRVLRSVSRQALTTARDDLAGADRDRYRRQLRARMLRSAAERLAGHTGPDRAAAPAPTALAAAVAEVRERLRGSDPAAATAPVRAPWSGLGVELVPDGGWRSPAPECLLVRVTLAHRPVDEFTLAVREVRARPSAVADALGAWVGRLTDTIMRADSAVQEADERATDAAHRMAEYRFEHDQELADAQARLDTIRVALETSVDDAEGFDPLADDADDTDADADDTDADASDAA